MPVFQAFLGIIKLFLEKLYDKSAVNLIASLYHGRKISQKEIEELRNYLDLLGEK